MAKFINPFTDIGFKRIFGQEFSKPLLLNFLNNLLVGEKEIVDITFLDKEQPAIYEEDRSLIYDVYCKTTDGDHIIVEMQNKGNPSSRNEVSIMFLRRFPVRARGEHNGNMPSRQFISSHSSTSSWMILA